MRVVLAIQHRDLGLALQLCLDAEPTCSWWHVTEAASLRALLWTAHPDLVILDWDLPGYAFIPLLAEVKRAGPLPRSLCLAATKASAKRPSCRRRCLVLSATCR